MDPGAEPVAQEPDAGLVRRVLVWYFGHVSLVGVIYGSIATVVVLLLTLETAALIVLLGAQVIAEIGRSARAKVPWWVEPSYDASRVIGDSDSGLRAPDSAPGMRAPDSELIDWD